MLKNIYISIAIALFSIGAFSQSFEFSNSHTAIHVKDANKSAEFYAQILLLDEMDTPEGMPNTIRWFYLSDNTQVHFNSIRRIS